MHNVSSLRLSLHVAHVADIADILSLMGFLQYSVISFSASILPRRSLLAGRRIELLLSADAYQAPFI